MTDQTLLILCSLPIPIHKIMLTYILMLQIWQFEFDNSNLTLVIHTEQQWHPCILGLILGKSLKRDVFHLNIEQSKSLNNALFCKEIKILTDLRFDKS